MMTMLQVVHTAASTHHSLLIGQRETRYYDADGL